MHANLLQQAKPKNSCKNIVNQKVIYSLCVLVTKKATRGMVKTPPC